MAGKSVTMDAWPISLDSAISIPSPVVCQPRPFSASLEILFGRDVDRGVALAWIDQALAMMLQFGRDVDRGVTARVLSACHIKDSMSFRERSLLP